MEAVDYKSQRILKRILAHDPDNPLSATKYPTLRNLFLCGSGITPQYKFIHLSTGSNRVHFHGSFNCHSAWACPVCTPQVMAAKAGKIACLIDAMSTWYNQDACMITFTIPHIKTMSCKDTYTLLQKAWRHFTSGYAKQKAAYTIKTDRVRKKGEKVNYKLKGNVYQQFRTAVDSVINVKVTEFTWGENSWHPHYHCLFFVPRQNFNKILDYEEKLNQFWMKCIEKAANKYYSTKMDTDERKKFIREVFTEKFSHAPLYISKSKGAALKVSSSFYLTGWSGDKELASPLKTARNGHYTPFQILDLFVETGEVIYRDLFVEYAQATVNHRRCEFSVSKLNNLTANQIIAKWKKSNRYSELLKKKGTSRKDPTKVIVSFRLKQWSYLSTLNLTHNIKPVLIEIALRKKSLKYKRRRVRNFLRQFGIEIGHFNQYEWNIIQEEIAYITKQSTEFIKARSA